MARIIPVLDVMHGVVVHAVAGNRREYRPIRSNRTHSTDPVEVARVLLDATGAQELYVADLDAILQHTSDNDCVTRLAHVFPQTVILADAGIRTLTEPLPWPNLPNVQPIVGTETLTERPAHARIVSEYGLSLDFHNGEWLGNRNLWIDHGITPTTPAAAIAPILLKAVPTPFVILLDLAVVGTTHGPSPFILDLIRSLRANSAFPKETAVLTGGGVRNRDDIARFADAGADAVLVASALHDRRLP